MVKKRIEKIEEGLDYVFDALRDEELELFVELSGHQEDLSDEERTTLRELCGKIKVRLPNGELANIPC